MIPFASHTPVIDSTLGSPRIGAVSYLNSKPLVWHLGELLPAARRSLDLPSRLADDLAAGQLDVALLPIVEHFRQPQTQIVSTACIACIGPVWSVKTYFRCPPEQVRTLTLDEGSRTSAALCQVLLHHTAGVRPKLASLPIGDAPESASADAILVIGDRAMQPPREDFVETWDLGQAWHDWTGLPFVFAAWVAAPRWHGDEVMARQLDAARDAGVASIDAIARHEAPRVGLTFEQARRYLSHHLQYTLGLRERQAIDRFALECRALGLA